ncbi:hypothetical protein ACFT2C_05300 [Promicromonospora sp. NPDC057138]|uniref:hypothetical protein n=1 Tax=Promicromonospora sp. NPDC057138 TaxID=3346031 RepID=UPI0036352070
MHNATDQIVSDYLDDLEHLLQHADAASVAVMAPTELERTICALLVNHTPRRLGLLPPLHHQVGVAEVVVAPGVWPYRAWQTAHQRLVTAAPAHPTEPIVAIGGPR